MGREGHFLLGVTMGERGVIMASPPSVSPLREAICFVLGPVYQWEGVMARHRDLEKLCVFALELGRAPRRLFLRRAKKVANVDCKQRDDVLDGSRGCCCVYSRVGWDRYLGLHEET